MRHQEPRTRSLGWRTAMRDRTCPPDRRHRSSTGRKCDNSNGTKLYVSAIEAPKRVAWTMIAGVAHSQSLAFCTIWHPRRQAVMPAAAGRAFIAAGTETHGLARGHREPLDRGGVGHQHPRGRHKPTVRHAAWRRTGDRAAPRTWAGASRVSRGSSKPNPPQMQASQIAARWRWSVPQQPPQMRIRGNASIKAR